MAQGTWKDIDFKYSSGSWSRGYNFVYSSYEE